MQSIVLLMTHTICLLPQYFEEVCPRDRSGDSPRRFQLEDPLGRTEVIALGSIRKHGYLFVMDGANPTAPYRLLPGASESDSSDSDSELDADVPTRAPEKPCCVPEDFTPLLMPVVEMSVVGGDGAPCMPTRCPKRGSPSAGVACDFAAAGYLSPGKKASFTPSGPVVVKHRVYKCRVHNCVLVAKPAHRGLLEPPCRLSHDFIRLGEVRPRSSVPPCLRVLVSPCPHPWLPEYS